jgi:hypothetical protein
MHDLRETLPEYLASFCLAQEGEVALEVDALETLSRLCSQKLQYWEIVYVVGERHRAAIEHAAEKLRHLKNLRIVLVRDAMNFYRRRTVAATEAIGDVVVVSAFNEVSAIDIVSFAEEAMASNRVVLGRSTKRRRSTSIARWLLGVISRYRADALDLQTIAAPRSRLVAILARPTAAIDLRFEPKTGLDPYQRKCVDVTHAGGAAGLGQKLELLVEIISTSAPRFLAAYALTLVVVAGFAACYGAYAIAVVIFLRNVQPGWFSTAIAQSGSATFLALGMAVISLGVANIIERMETSGRDSVIDEIGNISFADRAHDLNVEVGTSLRSITR